MYKILHLTGEGSVYVVVAEHPWPPPSGKRTVSSNRMSRPSIATDFFVLAAPVGFHVERVTDTILVSIYVDVNVIP